MKYSKRRRHQRYMRRWLRDGAYAGGQCERCNEPLVLIFRYDAVCCPQCNQWVDEKCGDPDCCFCGGRPDTPAEALLSEGPSITKDYYIKKYEKRRRQRFNGKASLSSSACKKGGSHEN